MTGKAEQNIVIVGGGFAGFQVAKELSKKVDAQRYNIILINSRSYAIALPAVVRLVVDAQSKLEETSFVKLDRLYSNGNGQTTVGVVTSIEAKPGVPGGAVVLASGERIPYAVLVLATGSKWTGPCAIPENEADVLPFVNAWRHKFSEAKHVVIVGGGAVGIELAGEVKDIYPTKKITIVHGGDELLNNTYNKSLRKGMQKRLAARGVEFMFNEYIDDIPEAGVVGVTTRSGKRIGDADLVVSARGGRPNSDYVSSLGEDALNGHGYVKVQPTLQLLNYPSIFALGDVIEWTEQKQVAKLRWHVPIVIANILGLLNGATLTKKYAGAPELIVITNGRNGGMGYFSFFGGFTLGDWFAWLAKARDFMVPHFRKDLGY
ncbi:NADH dehydrogenase FAD-containing subunit [Rhizopogon vesiculosus]|uniref:NADH dehydrogenase FAD-containing subunit n=1 Tax=Rhizopogon vesiculosus TaxID=180088 RepID=A0A1J8QFZ0_9AGAM|nr:NADH dehydrogenase FAD-containing subunit [Rhizopogon vesiculosus]